MEELAFLQLLTGEVALGCGPFQNSAHPPADGVAFYVNDFGLGDSEPWKIPRRWEILSELPSDLVSSSTPEIRWDPLGEEGFEAVFEQVQDTILQGRALKMVPVITETGALLKGSPSGLIPSLDLSETATLAYGYSHEETGFIGQSPERFIEVEENQLSTMALAGTARPESENQFSEDPKEIREHELVAGFLSETLGQLGQPRRGERRLCQLGSITHFATPFELCLDREISISDLVRTLHPTPALGCLPHEDKSLLQQLEALRDSAGCPPQFGTPFGFWNQGRFESVVTIRGLFWSGFDVFLPSGCGLIEQSQLAKEWSELALKRATVKTSFGIAP